MNSESIDTKVARMDERLKSVERMIGEVKDIVQDTQNSTNSFHEKANREFVDKNEFLDYDRNICARIEDVKKNIVRNLIATNILTSAMTALVVYLIQHYLTHPN